MYIKNNSVILFIGDSITDFWRNKEDENDLGKGYALITTANFNAAYPELNAKFINRGVDGNRTRELKARWQKDCIDLQPDYVSILIGINDTWRKFDSNDATSVEEYEQNYTELINDVKHNTNAKLILMEPFLLPVNEEQNLWRSDLDPKIQVVRKLARKYDIPLVPLDSMFAQASTLNRMEFWIPDGVHPSPAGHALIAKLGIETVEKF